MEKNELDEGKDEKVLDADLKEKAGLTRLIQEARKTCGFAYISTRCSDGDEPYDNSVYNYKGELGKTQNSNYRNLLALRGFKKIEAHLDENHPVVKAVKPERHNDITRLMKECEEVDRPVNEVVFYGITGVEAESILFEGETIQDYAHELSYSVARKEKVDGDQGDNAVYTVITQIMVGPEELITKMAELLKKSPELLPKVFEGVFPKLEQKYHPDRNGRVLFQTCDEYAASLKDPDYLERLAVDYEVKGE
jgi:hypothetical protein